MLDPDGQIHSSIYLPTKRRPVKQIKAGLSTLAAHMPQREQIRSAFRTAGQFQLEPLTAPGRRTRELLDARNYNHAFAQPRDPAVIWIPRFAYHAYSYSGLLRHLGHAPRVLPLLDREAQALGERHALG